MFHLDRTNDKNKRRCRKTITSARQAIDNKRRPPFPVTFALRAKRKVAYKDKYTSFASTAL
ncbi:hypothetical protein KCQ_16067 [Pectobacterium atrosepticum ICMP 1526]|uniref:Uncharacterized protein n=1 Tax=Pectobacterium peruviense TaxID=2066479 RepID=A0ABX4SBK0_9GAMM|nr:hypothetical protein EV46_10815 [Pectobacterium atrosepticum]KMK78900.1 hypothetical protein KCQ_16067 [Pectobacterium atrosepticum ICMP 1526]KML67291.1 hypothetical protein G033_11275 [Pectobacterium peruviense]KFX25697.1 hypothetical protein KP24_03135 [Pectobacterium atrosepticum]PKX84021.1 hypothetical protein A0G02_01445 [Pectobacterium peruviense]